MFLSLKLKGMFPVSFYVSLRWYKINTSLFSSWNSLLAASSPDWLWGEILSELISFDLQAIKQWMIGQYSLVVWLMFILSDPDLLSWLPLNFFYTASDSNHCGRTFQHIQKPFVHPRVFFKLINVLYIAMPLIWERSLAKSSKVAFKRDKCGVMHLK